MSAEKTEALRLARALIERHGVESFQGDAAAELRRLAKAEAQRDALLGKLKTAVVRAELRREGAVDVEVIRAAIKAVEENK